MVVEVVRLEKRPAGAETLVEASKSEHVLPLWLTQFPHITIAPSTVKVYEVCAPGMPVGVLFPRQIDSGEIETARPRQFVIDESSSNQGQEWQQTSGCWYVDHFLNGSTYL